MSGVIWSKFFWSDWHSEPALRLCSYAARGLWMDMLCIAAAHDPIGYVAVAGRGLDSTSIARMTGGSESEVASLISELDRNGVFSRDRQGRIYSRRMVSDAKKAALARENGKQGGNPKLRKDYGNNDQDNPPVKLGVGEGDKPHKPLTNLPEERPTTTKARAPDFQIMLDEAVEAAGDMADMTSPAMHHVVDLRALTDPTSGEPCTWSEVLDAVRMVAMRQRAKRRPIRSWSWIQDDAWALRDKRLNSSAPDVAAVVPIRSGGVSAITDRIAADNAEARRRALERMDANG